MASDSLSTAAYQSATYVEQARKVTLAIDRYRVGRPWRWAISHSSADQQTAPTRASTAAAVLASCPANQYTAGTSGRRPELTLGSAM
jgi:hypothetical protein